MKIGDRVICKATNNVFTVYTTGLFTDGTPWITLLESPGTTYNPENFALELIPKSDQSLRHNSGKINPIEIDPNFIMGMSEVLTKSRAKYPEFNWAKTTKLSTPYQSLFRHLMSFQSGEDFDPEDGCHHMLKVAVNAMFLYYHNTNFKEESDDRFFKKKENK